MMRRRDMRPPSPRTIVLGVLVGSFAWALVLPLLLTEPPSPVTTTLFVAGLAVFGLALFAVLRAAIGFSASGRDQHVVAAMLVAACLGMWWPTYAWAESGQEPWAWLAAFVISAVALVSYRTALVVGLLLGAAAVAGAVVFHGSLAANLVILFGCAAVVWAMCQVLVWLLRLLRAAEAGRDAEAELAVAAERLRVSRELHDVLGHRLGIIALKAELAADLADTNPARAVSENDEIRQIASTTLTDARQAVHGDTVADLGAQLASAELVLTSAGIAADLDADPDVMAQTPAALSRLLASVVRESVTNILRHSDAHRVSITLAGAASPRLVVMNDGLRTAHPAGDNTSGGTGLASLAARCAEAGWRLTWGATTDGRFEVRAESSPGRAVSL